MGSQVDRRPRPQQRGRSPWPRYLLARGVAAVGLLLGLVVTTFLIVRLVPGDPARNVAGQIASPEVLSRIRAELGLSEPLVTQFADYVRHLAAGNLGTSFATSAPVASIIGQRLPVTAELVGLALVIVIIIAFPLGMVVAALGRGRRGMWSDGVFTAGASLAGAVPEYITGTLLIFVFALKLKLLPAQGGASPREILLPAVAVALVPAAVLARLVRNETAEVLGQDYITVARSRHLPAWRMYLFHVLPNVATSTLTLGGLLLVALLGGTVVTENVFAIPGLGTEIVSAIQQDDYPTVQGVILVLGLLALAINLTIDVVLGLIDPRRRAARLGP